MAVDHGESDDGIAIDDMTWMPWIKERRCRGFEHPDLLAGTLTKNKDMVVDVGASIVDDVSVCERALDSEEKVVPFDSDSECFDCCMRNRGSFAKIQTLPFLPKRKKYNFIVTKLRTFLQFGERGYGCQCVDELKIRHCDAKINRLRGRKMSVVHGATSIIDKQKPIGGCLLIASESNCISSPVFRFGSVWSSSATQPLS